MARANLLQKFYLASRSPVEWNFDALYCKYRIEQLLSYTDIMDIHTIVNSVRYMGNAEKRVNMIDQIMRKRYFRKFHAGTNRTVYIFLDDNTFVAKVPIDKNGEEDNIAEFHNQQLLKPFCTKMFQCSQFGTVSFSERVMPLTSREEYLSVANDIFNLIVYKLLGKYVIDDIGASRFMNFGIRIAGSFGPVLLDYPKVFVLDGNKLKCGSMISGHICNGDIDYDEGFDILRCTVCGAQYAARDLASSVEEGKINLIKSIDDEGGKEIMKVSLMKGNDVLLTKDLDQRATITYEKKETTSDTNVKATLVKMTKEEESSVQNNPTVFNVSPNGVNTNGISSTVEDMTHLYDEFNENKEDEEDTDNEVDDTPDEEDSAEDVADEVETDAAEESTEEKYNTIPEALRQIQDEKNPESVSIERRKKKGDRPEKKESKISEY